MIDPNKPIAGLRPATLKRLFGRREINVRTFSQTTGVPRDAAPGKLQDLADLGWLVPDQRVRNRWETTEKADRLAVTSLTPPITVAMARNLVSQVIAAAEAINGDPSRIYLVERLVIFTEELAGSPDEQVNDVELGYDVAPRRHLHVVGGIPLTDPRAFELFKHWGDIPQRLQVQKKVRLLQAPWQPAGVMIYEWDRVTHSGRVTVPW